jgi:hypothetical protein
VVVVFAFQRLQARRGFFSDKVVRGAALIMRREKKKYEHPNLLDPVPEPLLMVFVLIYSIIINSMDVVVVKHV